MPLLPFTLAVFLLYDAACGRRRALIEATVAASFAMQSHLAFVILTGLLLVWGVAWAFFWPKVVPADVGDEDDPQALVGDGVGPPRPTWSGWKRPILLSAVIAIVLWIGPIFDALFDLHNPLNIARYVRLDRRALRLSVGPQPGRSLRASRRTLGGRHRAHEGGRARWVRGRCPCSWRSPCSASASTWPAGGASSTSGR